MVVLAETQRVEVAGGADDHLNEFDGKRADIVPLLQAYDPLDNLTYDRARSRAADPTHNPEFGPAKQRCSTAPSEVCTTRPHEVPVPLPLPRRRVPKWVPNCAVLAGLARTDRTVTWTRPLLLGLDSLPRTETGGLLIRRFRVQVPGAYREKPQVRPHIGVAWGFVVSGRNDPVVRLVPQLVVQWLFCDRLFCAGSRWTRWLR